jgi:hypothetical protein
MYQKKEKSVWLQGTFGSGKTHATTVVKNLLSNEFSEINDYIEHAIKEPQVKYALKNFRTEFKTFPIILKGSYYINDSKTFDYAIQQEVVNALKSANINEPLQNSYNDMIDRIEKNKTFWNEIIVNSRLIDEVSDVDELTNELKTHNDSILRLCEDELTIRGMGVITSDIIKFLESATSIVKKHGYSHITLVWDEFTPILEVNKYNDILMSLQNLSENIKNGNVFLFIVAHRTPNKNRVLEEDIKKIHDRFELTHYKMEDVTTYSLLANSIQKTQSYEQSILEFKNNDNFKALVKYVLNYEDNSMNVNNLFDMLPIHPYSGLILSLIARQLKSSNRSIFSFLHAQSGFISFLEEETENLMDISYLWKYFLEIFKEDNDLQPYIYKYIQFHKELQSINKDYITIFQAILLMNILNKVIGGDEIQFIDIFKPHKENLKYIFIATKYYNIVDNALDIISKKFIQPDSDGVYLVSSATLPENEVFLEKERLKQGAYKSILPILKSKENEIKKQFVNGILRHHESYFSEAIIKDYDIKKYAESKFSYDYTLHLMFFFANEESELLTLKKTLKEITPNIENKIFIVIENSFSNDRYLKFIDYKARESIAKRHNHGSESERNRQQADKLIEQYINGDLKSSSIMIYFGDDIRNGISMSNFANEINSISKKIFHCGADSGIVKGYKLWAKQNPTKTIPDNIIKSYKRDELNLNLTGQHKPLNDLLKDKTEHYILDENFKIKDESSDHFLITIIKTVDTIIEKKKKSGDIHLGKALKFLTKPPYGLYSNPISFAILSLALKRFDSKFYEIGNGRKIENSLLRDYIVNIFKFFDEDTKTELRVKFGTEHEDKLIDILKEIFSLEIGLGIAQYTFKIKNWVSGAKYPLWVVKYSINANKNINEFIDKLTILVNAHDEDIQFNDIKSLVEIVENNVLLQDIKILLQKNKFSEYFDLFIKSLNLNIDNSYYDELYDFIKSRIRANQDSDISGWDENTVFRLVYEWEKEKFKPILPEPPTEPLTDEDESVDKPHHPVQSDKPTRDDIEKFKSRIKYMSLSQVVIDHVDEDLELYKVLKKYVMD